MPVIVPSIGQSPYPLGSPQAQAWWRTKVVPKTKAAATPAMKAKYGKDLRGMYKGKPLRPGVHPGDGDFQFVVDSARIKGYSKAQAQAIAGRIQQNVLAKQGQAGARGKTYHLGQRVRTSVGQRKRATTRQQRNRSQPEMEETMTVPLFSKVGAKGGAAARARTGSKGGIRGRMSTLKGKMSRKSTSSRGSSRGSSNTNRAGDRRGLTEDSTTRAEAAQRSNTSRSEALRGNQNAEGGPGNQTSHRGAGNTGRSTDEARPARGRGNSRGSRGRGLYSS